MNPFETFTFTACCLFDLQFIVAGAFGIVAKKKEDKDWVCNYIYGGTTYTDFILNAVPIERPRRKALF